MKSFKQFLALKEGAEEATFVEQVIIEAWNLYAKTPNQKRFIKELQTNKKLSKLKNFLLNSKKLKLKDPFVDFYNFASNLHQKIKSSGVATSAGQSKPRTSKFWTEHTGKGKDTSKADILIGNFQVSVKDANAQLMSGARQEIDATALASAQASNLAKSATKKMTKIISNFADSTRIEGLNTTELKKLPKSKIKGVQNKRARKILDDATSAADDLKSFLNTHFNDPKFQKHFAFEAMSGWEKFGGKTFKSPGDDTGRADSVLVFSDDLQKVKFEDVSSISKKSVGSIAKQMNVVVSMKSTSFKVGGKKAGYSFWQTLRLGIKTTLGETDKLQEEIDFFENQLNENLITEIEFRKVFDKIKSKILGIWEKFKNVLKGIVKKINEIASRGLEFLMDALHIDMDVKVNTTVKLL